MSSKENTRSKKRAKKSQANSSNSSNQASNVPSSSFTDLEEEFQSFEGLQGNTPFEWTSNAPEIKMEERHFWNFDEMLERPFQTMSGHNFHGNNFISTTSSSSSHQLLANQSPQSSPLSGALSPRTRHSGLQHSQDMLEESPSSSPSHVSSNSSVMNSNPLNLLTQSFPQSTIGRGGPPSSLLLGLQQPLPLSASSQQLSQQSGVTPNTMEPIIQRPSSKAIQEVQKLIPQISTRLENMGWTQKQLTIPLRREIVGALDKEQKEMKTLIEMADKQLNTLMDSVFLEPIEMHQVLQLQQDLFFHLKQLELYNLELQGLQKDNFIPSMALVIIAQPFPESVKQKKKIDEPGVTVRLLTGARFSDSKPSAPVKAEIINFSSSTAKTKKSTFTLEHSEKTLNEHGIARFTDLNFPNGTRLKSVRLKFTSRIDVADSLGQMHSITVESNPSNPIVVKTNENQWFEAEGILLQKAAFGNALEITWQRLANWLQRRYLMATRQSLQTPTRPLSQHDLNYLHRLKFSSAARISQKDFDKFWEWCGPLFHKIRYQRHLCSLWTAGYICGFLTREEVETVLKSQAVGTFLIRFSDRMPKFVVSYQSADEFNQTKVKHYLVKSDDTHGAKKTLPDFLNSYRELLCILQIWTDPVTNKRILRRCDKDTVLTEYYSKKSDTGFNGYEDDISV